MYARPLALGLAAGLLLGAVSGVAAQDKSLDDLVVANVNGEDITRRQLVARLLEYYGDDALQRMVNRAVLLQAAKKYGVTVSEEETNKKIDEIKKNFRNPDDFQKFLTQSNLTEKQYRDEVKHTVMLEKVALKETPLTDDDLQQYEIRVIAGEKKEDLEKTVKDLDAGGDFAKLAAERSLDPNAKQNGGKLRPFMKVELLDVWRAINDQKLQKGAYTKTPVLLADNSWVLIKLENVVPVSMVSATEKERLSTLVTRFRMDQWLNSARTTAKVAFPVPLTTVVQGTK